MFQESLALVNIDKNDNIDNTLIIIILIIITIILLIIIIIIIIIIINACITPIQFMLGDLQN